MTKKHYELIATAINGAFNANPSNKAAEGIAQIAKDLAEVFLFDNPRFDRERFLKACGVGK